MLSHSTSSVVPWSRKLPADPDVTMLDLLGPVDGLHVVVIGPGGLAPMLALHRLGAMSVTMLCHGRCRGVTAADAAVIARVDSVEMAEAAISLARRTVRPMNSLVMRLRPDAAPTLNAAVRRILVDNGFAIGRTVVAAGATVVLAELPSFRRLKYG